jgi:uncharacterized protein (DUF58 family)
MLRTRPTVLGKIFLVLMGLFYVACVTSQSGLLLLFIGLVSGCFAVNWNFSRRNTRKIVVHSPRKVTLVEGETSNQPWQISNPTAKHIELVEIFSDEELLFRIPFLKTGETLALFPNRVFSRRGVYPFNQVMVTSNAPFGLLRSCRKLELRGEVVVLPCAYETDPPGTIGVEMVSGGRLRGRRRVNSGSEFAGVRAWEAGDTLKQVHWKSTARRGEMMVKTFEEELGGRVSILIDGRYTKLKNKSRPLHSELLDDCLRAAASVAVAALREGHHIELAESLSAEHLRLAPFSDEGELLERLARYQPDFPALELGDLWRRSSLVLAGVEWQEEWAEFIREARRQKRKVAIYLPAAATIPESLEIEIFRFYPKEIAGSGAVSALC